MCPTVIHSRCSRLRCWKALHIDLSDKRATMSSKFGLSSGTVDQPCHRYDTRTHVWCPALTTGDPVDNRAAIVPNTRIEVSDCALYNTLVPTRTAHELPTTTARREEGIPALDMWRSWCMSSSQTVKAYHFKTGLSVSESWRSEKLWLTQLIPEGSRGAYHP